MDSISEEDIQGSIDDISNTPINRDYAIESGIDGDKLMQ